MTPDDVLKKKTIYKYRAYAIEQMNYDGSWRFMHYCPDGLQVRTWENNSAPLKNCDRCNEVISEEIILLWGLIDTDAPRKPMMPRNRIVNL